VIEPDSIADTAPHRPRNSSPSPSAQGSEVFSPSLLIMLLFVLLFLRHHLILIFRLDPLQLMRYDRSNTPRIVVIHSGIRTTKILPRSRVSGQETFSTNSLNTLTSRFMASCSAKTTSRARTPHGWRATSAYRVVGFGDRQRLGLRWVMLPVITAQAQMALSVKLVVETMDMMDS